MSFSKKFSDNKFLFFLSYSHKKWTFCFEFLNFWSKIVCLMKVSLSDNYIKKIYLKLLIFCPYLWVFHRNLVIINFYFFFLICHKMQTFCFQFLNFWPKIVCLMKVSSRCPYSSIDGKIRDSPREMTVETQVSRTNTFLY